MSVNEVMLDAEIVAAEHGRAVVEWKLSRSAFAAFIAEIEPVMILSPMVAVNEDADNEIHGRPARICPEFGERTIIQAVWSE